MSSPASVPYPVILASASPRRQALLRDLYSDFRVVPAALDEDALTLPDPFRTAHRLAEAKTEAVFRAHPGCLVLGGDTVVAVPQGDEFVQYAKPVDPDDAVRMLTALSGRTHTVATGVGIFWPRGSMIFVERTEVTFRELSLPEIREYVATGEPMDKAGAYGLQGLGGSFVAKFDGLRSTVIGYPIEKIKEALIAHRLL